MWKKNNRFVFLCIVCLISFSSCSWLFDNSNSDSSDTNADSESKNSVIGDIEKNYWGTWIRMDTGDEYYIDSEKMYKSSSSDKKSQIIDINIKALNFDSDNILRDGNVLYFRKGGNARSFSVQVSGFSDSFASRAISTGKQGIKGRRESKNNFADKEEKTSTTEGNISFTNAVADDVQTISIEQDDSKTSVDIIPKYDGENIGTIPIVEEGMYGFKTTYYIDGDEQDFCYGNYYKTYKLSLNLKNIGLETCATSVYEISFNDSNLQVISGDLKGNFSSIEAGKSKNVTLSVRYGKIEEEYVDVPINISITDSKYERTWNDCITLRFHKGLVALNINSRNFDETSDAQLNGFVIYPDGRSKRFTVTADKTSTVLFPWSNSDYILAFSGATATNEMAYSFGFSKKTSISDLSGVWSIEDINAYENNDSTTTAFKVTDLSSPIKAYLKNGDIDFYVINNSGIDLGFSPVVFTDYSISDLNKNYSNNNDDGKINSGEKIQMDVRVKNITNSLVSDIDVILSSTSIYVTIPEPKKSYGSISAGYFKTLYGFSNYENNSSYKYGYKSSYDYSSKSDVYNYSSLLNASYGWDFNISSQTPAGTKIPFVLTFNDKTGNSWTDSFEITVMSVDVEIVYVKNAIEDTTSLGLYNNDDGLINPGETIRMDVRVQNKGKGLAQNIAASLSTTSSFINITENKKSYENIKGDYYKTLYGTAYYKNSSDYKNGCSSTYNSYTNSYSYNYSSSLNASYGWEFTVLPETPIGTKIPFTLSFCDSRNNTWSSSFELTVMAVDVDIVYSTNEITDLTSYSTNNNGDKKINAGEKIKMDVRVQNKGKSLGQNITAVLSSTSSYINITSSQKNYGNIKPDCYKTLYGESYYSNNSEYKYGWKSTYNSYSDSYSYNYSSSLNPSYGWEFTVSPDTPANTLIPFTLTFSDLRNNTWTESFTVSFVER